MESALPAAPLTSYFKDSYVPGGMDMKRRQAEILLASVILARSTSFLFSKTALEEMGLFELLALRFLLAFFLLALLYGRRLWREVGKSMILRGAVLGTVLYLVMAAEMMALRQSDIYVTAFLENTAFLFVPFFLWAGKGKRISWKTGQAMVLMTAGVSLLTVKGAGIHPGALWAMAAAFFYGFFIYLTGLLARRGDGLSLGIWQMGFMGLWNGCSALALGEWAMPSSPSTVTSLLALAFLCTAFGFTFQTVAQQYLSTEEAGFFSGLDPLFASVWGMVFRGENPGLSGSIGAFLVLAGMARARGREDGKIPGPGMGRNHESLGE